MCLWATPDEHSFFISSVMLDTLYEWLDAEFLQKSSNKFSRRKHKLGQNIANQLYFPKWN
jgi:hypothetical protein